MADAQYEVYEDEAGEWRWRLVEANGRIIAESGEGYVSKSNLERAIENLKDEADGSTITYDDTNDRVDYG